MKVIICLVDRLGIVTDKHVTFPQKNNPLFTMTYIFYFLKFIIINNKNNDSKCMNNKILCFDRTRDVNVCKKSN
jgi:hypothetical protein